MGISRNIELLILAFALQLFLIITSNTYGLVSIMSFKLLGMPANLITFLNIFAVIITIFLVSSVIKLTKKEQELFLLKKEQEHIANLSLFLRELKHDLNNQLFVVNGLLQLGNVEEASAYAKELSDQFDWMEGLIKLNQPEFASIILNKMMEAKNQGFSIEVNIATDTISNIPKDILMRTTGNLLDNALEALKSSNSRGQKKLVLDVFFKNEYLLVSVENTGVVPQNIAENMFNNGFSTKQDKQEHGLGLHIVKSLMDGIGGKITHENKEGTTIFQLFFPVI